MWTFILNFFAGFWMFIVGFAAGFLTMLAIGLIGGYLLTTIGGLVVTRPRIKITGVQRCRE